MSASPGMAVLRRLCAVGLMMAAATSVRAQAITVYSSGAVPIGDQRQLSAYVPLSPATVVWSVNGLVGGDATVGTVSSAGLYRAPAAVPANNAVRVSATSTAFPSQSGAVTITITQVPVHLWSTQPAAVRPGAFTLSLNGSGFGTNVDVSFDGTPLTTRLVSSTQLQVSGTATSAQLGRSVPVVVTQRGVGGTVSESVTVKVSNDAPVATPAPAPAPAPAPTPVANPGTGLGTANLRAGRFLEQAAFGPTPAALARVNQIGIDAWLNEQFGMPETPISLPPGQSTNAVQVETLWRLSTAPDQLRQRLATALGQILVVSTNKNIYPAEIVPYLQILSRNAFGNYRSLLGEISTSPQMGKYLDLANSNKPTAQGGGANENFARELMQLFTIGLVRLNPDGSVVRDAAGQPVPTYDQTTVQQLALAFTGWTYAGPNANNWENFSGPLQPRDVNHDMRAKSFLGCNLPGGQGAQADMTAALDCVFNHPNVGPFVATRLIRALVTSNPSPGYIARVAAVFNNNGMGQRGDLKAVTRAILLDAEARNDVATPTGGRLKDPILHIVSLLRSLGGSISAVNQLPWSFSRLGEAPLAPPSVFGFYSPLFRIPQSTLFGPEFQIYSPTEAVLRGNFIWQILSNPGSDFTLDLSPFVALGGDTARLIDAVDQALLYGRMPAAMRQSLANALVAQSDNRQRALLALYLTALSGLHLVQY